jgi:hypothetical protein
VRTSWPRAGIDISGIDGGLSTLEHIQDVVTVNGQVESDTLKVNDQGSTTPPIDTIKATPVQRTGAATLSFSSIDGLKVNKRPAGLSILPLVKNLFLKDSTTRSMFATMAGRLADSGAAESNSLNVDLSISSGPYESTPDRARFALNRHYTNAGTHTVGVIWNNSVDQSHFCDLRLVGTTPG